MPHPAQESNTALVHNPIRCPILHSNQNNEIYTKIKQNTYYLPQNPKKSEHSVEIKTLTQCNTPRCTMHMNKNIVQCAFIKTQRLRIHELE